ncbi:DUF2575 domain-containing protein [Serratia fonticola]|nr:DUF2575 domain-containing protein [Serratia sp. 3ACOL1]NTY85317.1 DUF2575 domain-containing protein [Serratia fonticola]NTZ11212.1 DUF2575 domain-containing protein [Serratia fonticola]QCR59693.1 DUF2575 domain-containing protein [Serratia fonticola]
MKVRTIERRLALCLRRFSDCMARFLADLILAKVQLPNIYIEDNSKAEEYALLAFVCQWICANKRRLYGRHLLRCDGAGFYQLQPWEYSVSREKSPCDLHHSLQAVGPGGLSPVFQASARSQARYQRANIARIGPDKRWLRRLSSGMV